MTTFGRRAFLAAAAAAPIAALAPFRAPTTWMATWHGIDFGAGDSTSVILWRYRRDMVELLGIKNELLAATTYRDNGGAQDVRFVPFDDEEDTFRGIHDLDDDDDDGDVDPDDDPFEED